MERDNSVKIEVQGKLYKVSGKWASDFMQIVKIAKGRNAKFDGARKVWVFGPTWSEEIALAQFHYYTVVAVESAPAKIDALHAEGKGLVFGTNQVYVVPSGCRCGGLGLCAFCNEVLDTR